MTTKPDPIEVLTEALLDCADYFDNRADVQDGDYGIPEANKEMRMLSLIAQALKNAGYKPMTMEC
jgi:hypothetical protein